MSLESRRERAERMLLDAAAVMPLPAHKLIERHNHALATIRALWVSRRRLQQQLANQTARAKGYEWALRRVQQRVAELEEDNAHLLNAQHDAQLNGGAQ